MHSQKTIKTRLKLCEKQAIGSQIKMAVRGTAASHKSFNILELNCHTENKNLSVTVACLMIV
jgi:hypothetical protein